MEKDTRNRLVRIIAAAILLTVAFIIEKNLVLAKWQLLAIYLLPYLIVGYETIAEALESIVHGEPMDEDFLMTIATVGALTIGFMPGAEPQFAEAVFVMLFFQLGELFEEIAEGKSRKSISALMDIRPDTANVERDGKVLTIAPDEIKVGETIVIRPGEKVPMDGVVVEGTSSLDTLALTGESAPRTVSEGDGIVSGCVNRSGLLRVRVSKPFGESTALKVLELVENASENKSKTESFITRFAKVYTPIVVTAAILLAVFPPLLGFGEFHSWLYRALTFLIVSCPCALVISVPLAFFGGIGGASRNGILVKGSNYLEALAKTGTVVFDKTGTLTQGVFEVTAVHPDCIDENELLHMAAHVERYSTHPIAVSLRNAYPHEESDGCHIENVEEIPGRGIKALVNGRCVCVGNELLMNEIGAEWKPCHHVGTIVHVAIEGRYVGHVVISDRIKDDSLEAVVKLRESGVSKVAMLTGDREEVGKSVATALGLDEYHAGLLPDQKVGYVERFLAQKPQGSTLAFVGDGINDAPVLARADVGIAMGVLGSDAAIEAADVVIMDDKPSRIVTGIKVARKALAIARENTIFAIGVKVAVLVLALFGLAPMWLAVFADVGVTVLAVLNSMRTLRA